MRSTTTTTTQGEASSSSIIRAPKRGPYRQHGIAKRTRVIRIIGRSLLCVIMLLGIAILTCWFVVIPRTPRLMVESGKVTGYHSTNRKLNATIVLNIRSYNPNKRASIYMDSMKMTVKNSMSVPFHSDIPNFTMTPQNVTVLNPTILVNFIYPFGLPLHAGWIHIELSFSAKVSYLLNRWASKPRWMEIYCNHFRFKIGDSMPNFQNIECLVDL
uniref:Late embryogenesis abundant protein LEA-2 subgroup domain-containing protein n=1 Tax=Cucumis melo TaxID=3656 RepID=A0A9I9EMN4_CUCME